MAGLRLARKVHPRDTGYEPRDLLLPATLTFHLEDLAVDLEAVQGLELAVGGEQRLDGFLGLEGAEVVLAAVDVVGGVLGDEVKDFLGVEVTHLLVVHGFFPRLKVFYCYLVRKLGRGGRGGVWG